MRNLLTSFQKIQAFKVLEAHCSKDKDGNAVYEKGYDDGIVAKLVSGEYGFECNSANIAGLRKEAFGNLPKSGQASNKVTAESYEALKAENEALKMKLEVYLIAAKAAAVYDVFMLSMCNSINELQGKLTALNTNEETND